MTKKNIRRRKGQKQNRRTMRGRNIKRRRNTKKGVNMRSGNNRKRLRTKKNMKGGGKMKREEKPRHGAKFEPYTTNTHSKIKAKAKASEAKQAEEEIINYNNKIFEPYDFDTCTCESHVWLRNHDIDQGDFRIESETLRGLAPEGRLMPNYTSKMREKMRLALSEYPEHNIEEGDASDLLRDINEKIEAEITVFTELNKFIQGEDITLSQDQLTLMKGDDKRLQPKLGDTGQIYWSDDINALIKLNQGFCPYCGKKLDINSATGEHSHGRTATHFLTHSLDPKKNIYCVTPMCGTCNKNNNPPSVVVDGSNNIRIFQREGNKLRQDPFVPANPRHALIFRMCLYRDIVSYDLMKGRREYDKYIKTIHLAKLMKSVFSPTTVRDPPEPDSMLELFTLFHESHRELNDLSTIIADTTLSKAVTALNLIHKSWRELLQQGEDESVFGPERIQDMTRLILKVTGRSEIKGDLLVISFEEIETLKLKIEALKQEIEKLQLESGAFDLFSFSQQAKFNQKLAETEEQLYQQGYGAGIAEAQQLLAEAEEQLYQQGYGAGIAEAQEVAFKAGFDEAYKQLDEAQKLLSEVYPIGE